MSNQTYSNQADSKNKQEIWGTPRVLAIPPDVTLSSKAVSNSLAVLFSPNLGGGLQGEGPTCLTQMLSFQVPLNIKQDQQLIGFAHQLRFGLVKSPGARVMITADLAGTSKTWEFGYDLPGTEPLNIAARIENVFSLQGLELASALGLGIFGPVADYHATLLVTAQRRNEQEHLLIQIDSLDISAHLTSQD